MPSAEGRNAADHVIVAGCYRCFVLEGARYGFIGAELVYQDFSAFFKSHPISISPPVAFNAFGIGLGTRFHKIQAIGA